MVDPRFWSDEAMVASGPVVMAVALYLITGPQSNASGIYPAWPALVSHQTKIRPEQVDQALARLEQIGFIELDRDRDLLWVVKMAQYQIGDALVGGDTRIVSTVEAVLTNANSPLAARWLDRYRKRWPGLEEFLSGTGKLFARGADKRRAIAQRAAEIARSMPHRMGHPMGHPMPHAMPKEKKEKKEKKNTEGVKGSSGSPAASVGAPHPPVGSVSPPPDLEPREGLDDPASDTREKGPSVDAQPSAELPRGSGAEGAAERFLARLARRDSAGAPAAGQSVKYLRDGAGQVRAAAIHSAHRAPGPWSMPAEVEAAVAPRLAADVPVYTRQPPPRVSVDAPDETVVEAAVAAWRAIMLRLAGEKYAGRIKANRYPSIAKAVRMLAAEGLSHWLFFDWAWRLEHERTRLPPKFYTVASPTFVGRHLDRALADLSKYPATVVQTPSRAELLELRARAGVALRQARPATAAAALAVVDRVLPQQEYDRLVAEIQRECVAAKRRDLVALNRGIWIWT